MTEKTKGKPTKDAITKFIADEGYGFVSSRRLANEVQGKPHQAS